MCIHIKMKSEAGQHLLKCLQALVNCAQAHGAEDLLVQIMTVDNYCAYLARLLDDSIPMHREVFDEDPTPRRGKNKSKVGRR